ncbi:hypothetical protein E2F43_11105 [Seongchinamella unica]|uniref:Mannose-6-phosphate isomerase n=1 Tax=Seongchinamella unica TaxID=2547392 RepID=A0A4R5LSY1_9GAMM|nr:hypothetical protein [Seongchinamella unica]TDG14028.1 hypothetical protein E2F43_11105 [Seongchinamella unica]
MSVTQSRKVSIKRVSGGPVDALSRWLDGAGEGDLLLVDFRLQQWWLPTPADQPLVAIYRKRSGGDGYECTVTGPETQPVEDQLAAVGLCAWATQQGLPVFRPGQPLLLTPVCIPKPWGQEIWFTGAEERGLCRFSDGRYSLPIPWVQALFPREQAGSAEAPLVLLKILDPLPREVTGDLYFELHEKKREVYVVTHVDRSAWPDGVGGIRYGFDPVKLGEAGSEEEFRQHYLTAVQAYEVVRRQIDELPQGVAVDEVLQQSEAELREQMNAFTFMRELRVGDVVVVPLLMPHSLQHGVRTIEFQTPVYERQILSFAQKVLTQEHWDTTIAVSKMRLTPPDTDHFTALPAKSGVTIERIVDFPDFEVRRITLAPGADLVVDCDDSYQLLMVVAGELSLAEATLGPEQGALLPCGGHFPLAHRDPDEALVLLLAQPCR